MKATWLWFAILTSVAAAGLVHPKGLFAGPLAQARDGFRASKAWSATKKYYSDPANAANLGHAAIYANAKYVKYFEDGFKAGYLDAAAGTPATQLETYVPRGLGYGPDGRWKQGAWVYGYELGAVHAEQNDLPRAAQESSEMRRADSHAQLTARNQQPAATAATPTGPYATKLPRGTASPEAAPHRPVVTPAGAGVEQATPPLPTASSSSRAPGSEDSASTPQPARREQELAPQGSVRQPSSVEQPLQPASEKHDASKRAFEQWSALSRHNPTKTEQNHLPIRKTNDQPPSSPIVRAQHQELAKTDHMGQQAQPRNSLPMQQGSAASARTPLEIGHAKVPTHQPHRRAVAFGEGAKGALPATSVAPRDHVSSPDLAAPRRQTSQQPFDEIDSAMGSELGRRTPLPRQEDEALPTPPPPRMLPLPAADCRVGLLGAVQQQGVYELRRQSCTIGDLLNQAGGLHPSATGKIKLVRVVGVSGKVSSLEPIIIRADLYDTHRMKRILKTAVKNGDLLVVEGSAEMVFLANLPEWVGEIPYRSVETHTVQTLLHGRLGYQTPNRHLLFGWVVRTDLHGRTNVQGFPSSMVLENQHGNQETILKSGDVLYLGLYSLADRATPHAEPAGNTTQPFAPVVAEQSH